MAQFSKTDQRRVTFLSLLSSAALYADDPYGEASSLLERMEEDGFFEVEASRPTSRPSSGRSSTSERRGSFSRPSNRGGGIMRDPDGPPSEKQVNYALTLTADYTKDELFSMSKRAVSDLIEDLKD